MPKSKPTNGVALVKPPNVGAPTIVREPWPVPGRQEWNAMSLDLAHALIQKYQAAYREGADIFNQRVYEAQREGGHYTCMVCRKKKAIVIDNHPNYVWKDDRQDPQTRIYSTRYICSQECYFRGSQTGRLTTAGIAGTTPELTQSQKVRR